MAGAITASTKSTTTSSSFKFVLARLDDGQATIQLLKDETVVAQAANVIWDDSIPWGDSTNYTLTYIGNYQDTGAPGFIMSNPLHREGIYLHINPEGKYTNPTDATHGCIAAPKDFLNEALKEIRDAGAVGDAIPLTVTSSGSESTVSIGITVNSASVKEGEKGTFTISLSGAGGNGVTKDIWVRIDVDKPFGSSVMATYDENGSGDFKISPTDPDGAVQNVPKDLVLGGKLLAKAGTYVKIPANTQSIDYQLVARNDEQKEGAGGDGKEVANLTISDYAVEDQVGLTYGDTKTQPGVLLPSGPAKASIVIEDPTKLLNENLSGGIEGLQKFYEVSSGDVISYSFDAFSIPDSLLITDGVSSVGTGGMVSGTHFGQLFASADQLSVVVVGSSSGTAWTLNLSSQPSIPIPTTLSFAPTSLTSDETSVVVSARESAMVLDTATSGGLVALGIAITAATFSPVFSEQVTVPDSGEAASLPHQVNAGHEYFVRVIGEETTNFEADLDDGYLKILEADDTEPVMVIHSSVLNGAPAEFFSVTADTSVAFSVGSDIPGVGGTATIELFDVTGMTAPILYIEAPETVSISEGEKDGLSVPVFRLGDVGQAASYNFVITPTGASPLSADDLGGGALIRTVSFEAGQRGSMLFAPVPNDGIAEGLETAIVSLDVSALPAEVMANMSLLGLRSEFTLEVDEAPLIQGIPFPVLSGADATATEVDGKLDFHITLSEAPSSPVSVFYTTVDETAVGGTDYKAQSGNLIFGPGETSKTISIDVLGDNLVESDETFALKILNPYGLFLQDNRDVLTFNGSIVDSASPGVGFLAAFGPSAGGWSSNDTYPRELADVNGDGKADIVGFASAGVVVSLATGDGHFASPTFELPAFGPAAGGWSSNDTYPRELGDVNGDGKADIVGFASTGVVVSLATGDGHFASPTFELPAFGPAAGGWSSNDTYPRELGDVNGDGKADIVGFDSTGVVVSLATGDGHFASPTFELPAFGPAAGGWSSNDTYPRELGDVNGDGMADIVGFASTGVVVSLATGDGHFASPTFELPAFGPAAGGWSSNDTYPRELGDVNGDGMTDIVGFASTGVVVSLATGDGHFASPTFELPAFGPAAGGWSSDDTYPREVADITGDHQADIVGFGAAGVHVSDANDWLLL